MDEILPIQTMIHEIRGCNVMIDSDLADLYQVENRALNQAVKRNLERFPADFMFQLTKEEWETLRSQNVISKFDETGGGQRVAPYAFTEQGLRSQNVTSNPDETRGGRRVAPYAFTEQGVAMLSSVINSSRAITVNIQIMRAFVEMRRYVSAQTGANEQITELRRLLLLYIERNDTRVDDILRVLNSFITRPPPVAKPIGFRVNREDRDD
ncbi:DNA-binding protein [Spirochaetia bacterium]|nr:DNA-binding protein [Spirochaetia bacterium]